MSTDQGNSWISLSGVPTIEVYDRRFWVDTNRIIISTIDTVNDSSFSELWELDLDSYLRDFYGISPHFDNGTQQTTLHPGDSIGVTFVPGAGTLAATDSVSLTLRWDRDAVSLSALSVPSGWWIADSSTAVCPEAPASGKGSQTEVCVTITLRADSAQSLPDPLLHAEFHTYLTPSESSAQWPNTTRTVIYLDNAHSFFPHTTPCAPTVLSLEHPDSVEIDFTGCGNPTILAAMQHAPPFSIESIVPNPGSDAITILLSKVSGSVSYELFDELGTSRLAGAISGYQTTLPVTSLASGSYYLRLRSNGYVETRKIEIRR